MDVKKKFAPLVDKLEQLRADNLKPATIAKAAVPPQTFVVARDILSAMDGDVDGDVSVDLKLTVGSARSTLNLEIQGGPNNIRRVYVEFANGVAVRVRKVLSYGAVVSSDAHEFVVAHDIPRTVVGLVAWVATGVEASVR